MISALRRHWPECLMEGAGLAGVLVATYISVEAPLSGMSVNPTRTTAFALHVRSGRRIPSRSDEILRPCNVR